MTTGAESIPVKNLDEAIEMAEQLFEPSLFTGYLMIKAFLDLYDMVKPEDRHRLAQILEGITK